MIKRETLYYDLLQKKMLTKRPLVLKYSSRRKICKECPDRLRCVTNDTRACLIRKTVDKDIDKTKRFFKYLFKGKGGSL